MKIIFKKSYNRLDIETLQILTSQNYGLCVWLQDDDGTPQRNKITRQPITVFNGFIMDGTEEDLKND